MKSSYLHKAKCYYYSMGFLFCFSYFLQIWLPSFDYTLREDTMPYLVLSSTNAKAYINESYGLYFCVGIEIFGYIKFFFSFSFYSISCKVSKSQSPKGRQGRTKQPVYYKNCNYSINSRKRI
jgi:hypothetical protein